jgi:hypothetical protein
VRVLVGVRVPVRVRLAVALGRAVGLLLGTRVTVAVRVLVGATVALGVRVTVGGRVLVALGRAVGVRVKVRVAVGGRVAVAVRVRVGVRVAVARVWPSAECAGAHSIASTRTIVMRIARILHCNEATRVPSRVPRGWGSSRTSASRLRQSVGGTRKPVGWASPGSSKPRAVYEERLKLEPACPQAARSTG